MTFASALFGGGSEIEYLSGVLYPARGDGIGTTASVANTDFIVPWAPRKTVTIDKVAWYRDNVTAGNVYVGIYDSAGTLLTDCAVDANTTAGWHAVNTTNVTLIAGRVYYLCWNASADVAGTLLVSLLATGSPYEPSRTVTDYGYNIAIGVSPPITGGAFAQKARTNAALLSSLVMSGWSQGSDRPPALGVIPA